MSDANQELTPFSMGNLMKVQFRIRGLNVGTASRRWLEQSLAGLQHLISITEVAVILERRPQQAPPFRAYVSLAVPGPDIHDEARGHTFEAVWLKVTQRLRKQIENRKARRQSRLDVVQRARRAGRAKPASARLYHGGG